MPYTIEEIEGMSPLERVRLQDKIALQYLEKKDKEKEAEVKVKAEKEPRKKWRIPWKRGGWNHAEVVRQNKFFEDLATRNREKRKKKLA